MRVALFAGLLVLATVACGATISQSADCRKYVTCFEATGGAKGWLDNTYGANGNCWGGNQATADACNAACKAALDNLHIAYPDKSECQ